MRRAAPAIRGTGCDMVRVSRVEHLASKYGQRFLRKAYSPAEIAAYERKSGRRASEFLAGRWAAKEATYKALGAGPPRILFPDISIGSRSNGQPFLQLTGGALTLATQRRVSGLHVSITHEGDLALAHVILD